MTKINTYKSYDGINKLMRDITFCYAINMNNIKLELDMNSQIYRILQDRFDLNIYLGVYHTLRRELK